MADKHLLHITSAKTAMANPKSSPARPRRGDPTAGSETNRTTPGGSAGQRHGWTLAVVLGLGSLLLGGYIAKRTSLDPKPEPDLPEVVVPHDPDQLDPQLRNYLLKFIRAAYADPSNAEVHGELGLVYEANEMWPHAQASFEIAAELAHDDPLAEHHIAICQESAGEINAAMARRQAIAERFPNFAPNHQSLGNLQLDGGLLDEAASSYQAVMRLAPGESAGFVGFADVGLRQGSASEAVNLLEPVTQAHPRDKSAHQILGLAYQRLGREAEAKRELALGQQAGKAVIYDAWTKQLPSHGKSLGRQTRRATAYLNANNAQKAIEIFEEALMWHPENVELLNNLAIACMRRGDLSRARALLLSASETNRQHVPTFVNLAACHVRLGETKQALEFADQAVENGPKSAQAHLIRGHCLIHLKRYEEALSALRTSAELDPRNASVHLALGQVGTSLDRLAEAKQSYGNAIDAAPNNVRAYTALAQTCLSLGEMQEAAAALEVARKLAPAAPAVAALQKRLANLNADEAKQSAID